MFFCIFRRFIVIFSHLSFPGTKFNKSTKVKKMIISCAKCSHYFVTHQKERPWGCRKFGFKSKILPNLLVKSSTGMECAYYSEKITIEARKKK